MEFRNLPGSIVVKEDNNLTVLQSIPGDITLILGTSPDGPLETLYLVSDSAQADKVFDPDGTRSGTLLRGMYEAMEGGSQNVALFRIGASPAFLSFLNGWTILRKETSSSWYTVYYSFTASTQTHLLKIFDGATGIEVYNSNTGIDTGALLVVFDEDLVTSTADITVGTLSEPVALDEVSVGVATAEELTFVLGETFFTDTETTSVIKAGMTVTIAGATNVGDNATYRVLYFYDNGTSKKVYLSHKLVGTEWVEFAGFIAASGASATATPKTSYFAEDNGLNLSNDQLYEALAKAYWVLESAKVDMVIPMGVYHDTPNLVNNLGASVVPSEADFLGKLYQFENQGQIFFIWQKDTDSVGEVMPSPFSLGVDGLQAEKLVSGKYTIESILNATAAPAEDIAFSEVNFSHQLGSFLHELSVNDNEAIGVVAMRGPKSYTRQGISQWLGVEPKYDTSGNMVVSGTGLLGDKWMVGSTGKTEGFFATANGLAGGSAVVDPYTKQKTDIGKYISVVGAPLLNRGSYAVSAAGYIAPAATLYGGLIQSLEPNQAPTNKAMKAPVALAFGLKKTYLDKLVAAKYVVFNQSPTGQIKVVDAPTATLKTSDYKRLLTVRCVKTAVELARTIADPFIGNMYTGEIRNALEEQVNTAFVELQKLRYLQAGKAEVRATRDQHIKGEAMMRLTLTTPGELRKIVIYVSLSKSN